VGAARRAYWRGSRRSAPPARARSSL